VGAERLVTPGAFNVMLSHNPDVFPVAASQGYDLTIAGHTHGGQVNVEILHQNMNIARYYTPYVRGLYREGISSVYVSSGNRHHRCTSAAGRAARNFSSSIVRYLILSDLHSNWEALQAVLRTLRMATSVCLLRGSVGYARIRIRHGVGSAKCGVDCARQPRQGVRGPGRFEWFNPVAEHRRCGPCRL